MVFWTSRRKKVEEEQEGKGVSLRGQSDRLCLSNSGDRGYHAVFCFSAWLRTGQTKASWVRKREIKLGQIPGLKTVRAREARKGP